MIVLTLTKRRAPGCLTSIAPDSGAISADCPSTGGTSRATTLLKVRLLSVTCSPAGYSEPASLTTATWVTVAPGWHATIALKLASMAEPHDPPLLPQKSSAPGAKPSTCVHAPAVQLRGARYPLLAQLAPSLKHTTSRGETPLGPLVEATKSNESAVILAGSLVGSEGAYTLAPPQVTP